MTRRRTPATRDYLEAEFDQQIAALGLAVPEREYFAIPGRKYRFDRAWPVARLLLEIQGGVWAKAGGRACPLCGEKPRGAHGSGVGIERDAEKLNAAAIAGWHVMQGTPRMVEDGRLLAAVEEYLMNRGSRGG